MAHSVLDEQNKIVSDLNCSLKKMNTRVILLLAIIFLVGCTTTRQVGSRGDATLHATKSFWPMAYPYSVSFDQVALGERGHSVFKVQGLREAAITRFDIQLHSTEPLVDQSGEHLNKSPLRVAGFTSCALRFVVTDEQGRVVHSKLIRCSDETWFIESSRKGDYRISYCIGIDNRNFSDGDFSVLIDVVEPSKTTSDYIRIFGFGFPPFEHSKMKTANKTRMATPTSPSVFHAPSNFNINPAINAGPR